MRRQFLTIVLSLCGLYVSAQTLPIADAESVADNFVPKFSYVDTVNNIHYCIGRYEPKGYMPIQDHTGQWVLIKSANDKDYSHQLAPVLLRIQRTEDSIKFYGLNDFYDIDLYQFHDLSSDRFVLIGGRYSLHLYDTESETLSYRLLPGRGQYSGEDAISGTISGLSFFDDEQFLFGHVQGYGIFCYELSDSAQPKEIPRIALSVDNNGLYYDNKGEYHVFLNPTDNEQWDVLLARSDVDSESAHVRQLYTRFREIRYGMKGIPVQMDERGAPRTTISPKGVVEIQLADGTIWSVNLSIINP